jgi:starch-binding outer membrane protein, SusD/RagB family
MRTLKRLVSAASAAAALTLSGCEHWLTVPDPTVIDADVLDPVQDAPTLARSAQQNFANAYGWMIVYSSWFTGETDVTETFPTRNEFGRRNVTIQNGSLTTDVWFPLSQAASSAYLVLEADLPDPDSNINYARANLFLGYSFLMMAEQFCRGTVRAGPELTTIAMLDSAIAHFNLAVSRGDASSASDGEDIANAARVGIARAELQAGRSAQAIAAAQSVPADFEFNLDFQDDLAERGRLANKMWQFVRDRGSIGVAPVWRMNDPRVPFVLPDTSEEHEDFAPQDAAYDTDRGIPYAIQLKYPDYNAPVRLASGLEADYIQAEAEGTASQLALIQARRLANGRTPYAGPVDANSVLTEFLTQKGLDFYLEAKRLGDFRRHPNNILGMPVPGSTYWKPGFAPVGSQSCFPLPDDELDNNRNFDEP